MINYCKAYVTIADKSDERYHRKPIILHDNGSYLAEFDTYEQFKAFSDTLGFTCKLEDTQSAFWGGNIRYYSVDREFDEPKCHMGEYTYFWKLSELPEDVLPITLLSNGCLVTGYFKNDGKTISIYRPNPNAKEVYKPLSVKAHIEYIKKHGLF